MKYLEDYWLLVSGIVLIVAPVQWLIWCKVRIIRYREDIFEQRDELFDLAAQKGLVWDGAFVEAYEHLGHLTQIIEYLTPKLIMDLTAQMGQPQPRKRAADPELQKVIDETFARSAQRTWKFVFTESLRCKLILLMLPTVIKCLRGMSWALEQAQKIRASEETMETFVRSEAPVEMSLKVKPLSHKRDLLATPNG